jgi:hypothetical protein
MSWNKAANAVLLGSFLNPEDGNGMIIRGRAKRGAAQLAQHSFSPKKDTQLPLIRIIVKFEVNILSLCTNIFYFCGCILLRYVTALSKCTCNRNWDSCHFISVCSQHVSALTGHLQVKYNVTYTFWSTINATTDPLFFNCHLCGVSHLISIYNLNFSLN